jgi:ParB-like chromosome segregation protein Spo0J
MMHLDALMPAYQNNEVYRPVSRDDPDIQALADSIRQHGLKEPLVITRDGVILSGHRRRVACLLAGLSEVPCRVEPVFSNSPEFVPLLCEYNRQRIKSFDEVLREGIVASDPEESYRRVLEHRRRRAQVDADTITIEGTKTRCKISKAKEPFLKAIQAIIDDRQDYWPLTDRQIHYALLNDPPLIHAAKPESVYKNDQKSYRATIDLLTRARVEGIIDWESIHDPTRPVTVWEVYREPSAFLRDQLDNFLKGYYRDLQLSQANHIEIVGEKNTVDNIIRPVAVDYCIPYTLGRGYSSTPPRKAMAKRYYKSGKEKLVLLFLSDHDPEGADIPHSFARSMRDDFDVFDIEAIKVALNEEQVQEMGLPPQMKAKETSSRYEKFSERYGEDTFELEAVEPADLQDILREAIDGVLDLDAFNAEIEAEKRDVGRLDGLRNQLKTLLDGVKLDHGQVPDGGS